MNIKRKNKKTWLSHSGIDILNRCPRCFWLQYRLGIRQPQGIVSRLPSRFDKVLKVYFDQFRAKNELPDFIKKVIKGRLENPFQEVYFYHVNQKYGFYGKLDECLINPEGKYVVVDFKTTSSDPQKRKEIFPAYQHQIDEYNFLLGQHGKPVADYGYLIYFYPGEIKDLKNGAPLKVYFQKIKANSKEVLPRIMKAINVLEGEMPKPSEDCPYCQWHQELNSLEKNNKN